MFHAFQNLKSSLQNVVGSPAFDVGDKPNAAGIMFISRSIQALRGAPVGPLRVFHEISSFKKSILA
jgi:hypothetical protein